MGETSRVMDALTAAVRMGEGESLERERVEGRVCGCAAEPKYHATHGVGGTTAVSATGRWVK